MFKYSTSNFQFLQKYEIKIWYSYGIRIPQDVQTQLFPKHDH